MPFQFQRRLLNNLNASDVFALKVNSNSDVPVIEYEVELLEWSSLFIDLKFTYDDVYSVSRSNKPDLLKIDILRPDLFVAKESLKALAEEEEVQLPTIKVKLPRQLPADVDEEKLAEEAKESADQVGWFCIAQLVIQPLLKSGLDSLWSMYFTLQLVKIVPLFDIYIPAIMEIYWQEIRGLIDFDRLTPDYLINTFLPGYDMMKLLTGKSQQELELSNPDKSTDPGSKMAGAQSLNIMENLQLYIFVLVLFLLVLSIIFCFSCIKPIRKKLRALVAA